MIPLLAILLQATQPPAPTDPAAIRFRDCTRLVETDAARAATEAEEWRRGGGGLPAGQCLGLAYVALERWAPAAIAFEQAGAEAQLRGDGRAAQMWVLAGNAALAGGDAARARDDLGRAIGLPVLSDAQRGEAFMDRSRAQVALGNLPAAREDIDQTIHFVPADPLGWLLSANLARRMNDAPRARHDIAEALRLASDDASVQYEAGNVAAIGGVTEAARSAWRRAVEIAPNDPAGLAAREALDADAEAHGVAPPAPAPAPQPPGR